MRQALRQRLGEARAAARRIAIVTRPYEARRGIHGPRRFRTLAGAQGWVDANWPRGDAQITDCHSGWTYRRSADGLWRQIGGDVEPEPAPADATEAPYWMRPL